MLVNFPKGQLDVSCVWPALSPYTQTVRAQVSYDCDSCLHFHVSTDLTETSYAFLSVDLLNLVLRKVEKLQDSREQRLQVSIMLELPGEIVLNALPEPQPGILTKLA